MKAVTLHPIWAWLVIFGPKRIENRSWVTRHRGPLAIHAAKSQPHEAAIREEMARRAVTLPAVLPAGCLLGIVDLIDVVPYETVRDDPWAVGPICWMLASPRPLELVIPCGGLQRLWTTSLLDAETESRSIERKFPLQSSHL